MREQHPHASRLWCPRSDSNGDALKGTGPQPAVYTNSTTGAQPTPIIRVGVDSVKCGPLANRSIGIKSLVNGHRKCREQGRLGPCAAPKLTLLGVARSRRFQPQNGDRVFLRIYDPILWNSRPGLFPPFRHQIPLSVPITEADALHHQVGAFPEAFSSQVSASLR